MVITEKYRLKEMFYSDHSVVKQVSLIEEKVQF